MAIWGYHIPQANAQVSVDIPDNDPIYNHLDRLLNDHLLSDDLHGIHPLTLLQTERLIQELEPSAEKDRIQSYIDARKSAFMEVRVGLFGTNSKSVVISGIAARINPLLEQQEGRWQKGGVVGWTELRLAMQWQEWGALDLTPLLPLQWSNEGGGNSFHPELFSGSLKLGHGGFEAQIGRFPVRWGQAQSGGFILGGSQKPLTQLQIRNVFPQTLPSFLSWFGPIEFAFLIGVLDGDQVFPYSTFVGERMVIKPQPWLEMGMTQSVILGGKGSPHFSVAQGISEVLGHRSGDINQLNLSNRNFGLDFRLKIPQLNNATLYGEFIAEDCCAHLKRDISDLLGVSSPTLTRNNFKLSFEWLRTTEILYEHGTYSSGYENRNHLLGHTIGPDAFGYYLFAEHTFGDDLSFKWKGAFEQRGREQQAFSEDRYRISVQPTYAPWRNGWIRGELGFEEVKNFRFTQDHTRHHFLSSIEAGFHF